MYTKALIPGTNGADVPLIVIACLQGAPIIEQLRSLGWVSYGDSMDQVGGVLTLTTESLTLDTTGGRVLEDETNPVAPPGWWEAVDRTGGRAVAVVAPLSDLTNSALGNDLSQLIDDPGTAQALVDVRT